MPNMFIGKIEKQNMPLSQIWLARPDPVKRFSNVNFS